MPISTHLSVLSVSPELPDPTQATHADYVPLLKRTAQPPSFPGTDILSTPGNNPCVNTATSPGRSPTGTGRSIGTTLRTPPSGTPPPASAAMAIPTAPSLLGGAAVSSMGHSAICVRSCIMRHTTSIVSRVGSGLGTRRASWRNFGQAWGSFRQDRFGPSRLGRF